MCRRGWTTFLRRWQSENYSWHPLPPPTRYYLVKSFRVIELAGYLGFWR